MIGKRQIFILLHKKNKEPQFSLIAAFVIYS